MKYILCLFGFVAVGAKEFPNLIKSKKPRELVIYSVIFILVLAFGLMVLTDGTMTSTIKVMHMFYHDILKIGFKKA